MGRRARPVTRNLFRKIYSNINSSTNHGDGKFLKFQSIEKKKKDVI